MRPIDFLTKEDREKIRQLQKRIIESDDVVEIEYLHEKVLQLLNKAQLRYEVHKELGSTKKETTATA